MENVHIRGGSALLSRSLNILSEHYESPIRVHHELEAFYAEYPGITVWCKLRPDSKFDLEICPMRNFTPERSKKLEKIVSELVKLVESECTHGSYH